MKTLALPAFGASGGLPVGEKPDSFGYIYSIAECARSLASARKYTLISEYTFIQVLGCHRSCLLMSERITDRSLAFKGVVKADVGPSMRLDTSSICMWTGFW